MLYGNIVQGGRYGHPTSVVGEVSRSMSGNVILRVGQFNPDAGWFQTEHIVLTREEAVALAAAITAEVGA